jgi:anti-sigma regulatory factor (Ser/Thr protein kinase)
VRADSLFSAPRGGRRLELRIRAAPKEVSHVRKALGDLGLPLPLQDDACLLVSELVTNSIQHSGLSPHDRVRIRADWSGTRLRVDVYDRASAIPQGVAGSIRPPPGAESGWGLYLVDRVASRWGTVPGRHWFELELQGTQPRSA